MFLYVQLLHASSESSVIYILKARKTYIEELGNDSLRLERRTIRSRSQSLHSLTDTQLILSVQTTALLFTADFDHSILIMDISVLQQTLSGSLVNALLVCKFKSCGSHMAQRSSRSIFMHMSRNQIPPYSYELDLFSIV